MSVKKKRTIGPCRGVTWLYYVVFLWSRDFFPPLYLDPRFRPLLLKFFCIYTYIHRTGTCATLKSQFVTHRTFFKSWQVSMLQCFGT